MIRTPGQGSGVSEDQSKNGLERSVSVAVVKADHAPAIQAVIDGVNLLAAAIAAANPDAGLAIQTLAVTGGWIWNRWKFDRVRPVLEEVSKRIQSIECSYVLREEFADLLGDALRRISEQPDSQRRNGLRNILLRVIHEPRDHTANSWFLRCAGELDGAALQLLNLIEDLKELAWQNPAMSWDSLVKDTQKRKWEIYETLEQLASEHIIHIEGIWGMLKPEQDPSPLRFRLTAKGTGLLSYLRG